MNQPELMNLSDVAATYLHDALERVQNNRLTPSVLVSDMIPLLIDLTAQHLPNQHALGAFLLQLPDDALYSQLLYEVIPSERRALVTTLRTEYADLQIALENELGRLNFDSAAKLRDKKVELAEAIKVALSGFELQISCSQLKNALVALGWNFSVEDG